MQCTALVRLAPRGHSSRRLLRTLNGALRRVRTLAGFRRWQTFRSLEAPEEWVVAVDWDSGTAARAAVADPVLREWAEAVGAQVELLHHTFDRQLGRWDSVATLLRVCRTDRAVPPPDGHDSDFALRALAAPGSVRLSGARTGAGTTSICRIDFDTEDGLWHFLESPLCRAWSRKAAENSEAELWGLNLPRLEVVRASDRHPARKCSARPRKTLSLELAFHEENQHARVRLEGVVDNHGSELSERFCHALIQNGCQRLEVDVSGLEQVSAQALGMLTRAARSVKDRGGEFVLIDNEQRVNRVTRSRNLASSLTSRQAK